MKAPQELAEEIVQFLFDEQSLVEQAQEECRAWARPKPDGTVSYRRIVTGFIKGIIERGLE
jgi:hypothetical protein